MSGLGLDAANAVRWDTFSNRIYFDLEKWPVAGRLVLRRNADGKIDMFITKGDSPPVLSVTR